MRIRMLLIGLLVLAFLPSSPFLQEKKKKAVTQADWAKMLTTVSLFENSPDAELTQEKVTRLLEGRPDGKIGIDEFKKAIGNPQLVYDEERQRMVLTVVDPSATVFYFLVVPSKGKTGLKGGIKGGSQYWTFGSRPTVITRYQVVEDQVHVGDVYFKRGGIKRLGISIPKNGLLSSLEMEAGCSAPIMPVGGWDPERPLTNCEMAYTTVQTLDWGGNLPFKKNVAPIKLSCAKEPQGKGGLAGYDIQYDPYDIKEEGFYSYISDKRIGREETLIIDGCLKEKVFPSTEKEEPKEKGAEKNDVLTTVYLTRGRHSLTVNWNLNSCPGNVFLKRHDFSCDTVKKMLEEKGFVIGQPNDTVTQDAAEANLDNIDRYLEEEPSLPDVEEARPGTEEDEPAIDRGSLSPILPPMQGGTR